MGELDEIRRSTNTTPAPEAAEAPPMVCPACGKELAEDGTCMNAECDEYNAHV